MANFLGKILLSTVIQDLFPDPTEKSKRCLRPLRMTRAYLLEVFLFAFIITRGRKAKARIARASSDKWAHRPLRMFAVVQVPGVGWGLHRTGRKFFGQVPKYLKYTAVQDFLNCGLLHRKFKTRSLNFISALLSPPQISYFVTRHGSSNL